jgi:hypothetical protein
VRAVTSFEELLATPFHGAINALCWPRQLVGDFGQVIERLAPPLGVTSYSEDELCSLSLDEAGQRAVYTICQDLHTLRALGKEPVLNGIRGYPRDERGGPIATDVMSFHADRAPVPTDTWLCTYHGAPTLGLGNHEAARRVDDGLVLAELRCRYRADHADHDDDDFAQHLQDESYDLHYATMAGAQPFSFGVGHLWRIAVEWPGNPVLPCLHRAPHTTMHDAPRLLLIC